MQEIPLNEPGNRNPITSGSAPPYTNTRTVDSLFSDCLDQVLTDILGRRAKEAIYDYMERNYAVAREDIPKKIENFFMLTEELFGKGSKTIARCIMTRLWRQLGWKFIEIPGFEFPDYLEVARARIAREVVEKAKVTFTSETLSRQ